MTYTWAIMQEIDRLITMHCGGVADNGANTWSTVYRNILQRDQPQKYKKAASIIYILIHYKRLKTGLYNPLHLYIHLYIHA